MPGRKKFDVFLSHHSGDKPRVIQLKEELELRGLSVWLDRDQIRPGDLFARSIEDGLKSSRNILFIVTPNSMKSKWVMEEYYRALSLANSKKQPPRLIPIIFQMAAVPGFLESRNWVDFREESNYSQNLDKLVWGITGVKAEGPQVVEIPFVIAAMTLPQAGDLFEKELPEDSKFAGFKKILLAHTGFDPAQVYGATPDDWKFSPNPREEITSVIWETLWTVTERRQNSTGSLLFKPRFESADFFSADFDRYTKTWERLKTSGCVLVVDAVSLFHPEVMQRLQDFHVEPKDSVAMAVISPLDTYAHPLTRMIEDQVRDHLQMAYVKYASNLDIQCNFDVGSLRSFKRWAISALPDLVEGIRNKKVNPSNRDYLRQKMGVPPGVEKLIFRMGEEK